MDLTRRLERQRSHFSLRSASLTGREMALGERGAAVSDMVADVAVRSAIDVKEPGLGVKQKEREKAWMQ